jgi:hypothetical protein
VAALCFRSNCMTLDCQAQDGGILHTCLHLYRYKGHV